MIAVYADWPFFPEGAFIDNAVYSDLDALNAPVWSLEAVARDHGVDRGRDAAWKRSHRLTQTLMDFMQQCQRAATYEGVFHIVKAADSLRTQV